MLITGMSGCWTDISQTESCFKFKSCYNVSSKENINMILTKQLRNKYDKKEQRRRNSAEENSVQKLTIAEIRTKMDNHISMREFRLELKRRKERLRYMKITSTPQARLEYRARKRAEYAKRVNG